MSKAKKEVVIDDIEPQEQSAPQEQAAPQPQRTYNPFIDVVNEKPYTQISVDANPSQMAGSIPEPTYQANRVSSNENPYNMLNNDFGSAMGGAGTQNAQPINPAMNKLPEGDMKMGAEHMAKLIVDGYEQLHVFANKGLQIPERKIRKLQAEGEIDLSVEIPYDYGRTITAGEFIREFNEQNKDTLTVSKEFKKEVTPVLTRVLAKRGAGVTDEQYLMYLFGKDILVKGVIFAQIKGTMNDMIGVIRDYTLAVKENGYAQTPPQRPQSSTTPPKPPRDNGDTEYEPMPDPIYPAPSGNAEDFNFVTNEVVLDSAVQKHKVPESGKARMMERKKRDKEIQEAVARNSGKSSTYEQALAQRKAGKRGRKPKDYLKNITEEQVAEAIILSETKNEDTEKIEGLE